MNPEKLLVLESLLEEFKETYLLQLPACTEHLENAQKVVQEITRIQFNEVALLNAKKNLVLRG